MDVVSLDSSSEEDLPDFSLSQKRNAIQSTSSETEPMATVPVTVDCKRPRRNLPDSESLTYKKNRGADQKARKEDDKARKRQEKEMDRAVKKAEREARAEGRVGERQKQMIVLLDRELSESSSFMHEFALKMGEWDIKYRVVSHPTPMTICWKRVTSQHSVDESAKIVVDHTESDDNHVLIYMEAEAFALLVDGDKSEQVGGHMSSSLNQYASSLMSTYPCFNVTLVVCGIEVYYRNNKTRKNRQFREQVRNHGSAPLSQKRLPDTPIVTKEDVLEAVVKLQLYFNCVVRLIEKLTELPDVIVSYTRAIADIPYKKESVFSFHTEQGYGPSKKVSGRDTAQEAAITWQHMLMQFNHVSSHIAAAIVEEFTTPSSLYKAYSQCATTKEAELLLQDIVVRRGVGVTASSRRVGPALSRKIHSYLTCSNGEEVL